MVFQQTWTRVSHYFEMWSAKTYVQRLARSDAAQDNPQRENALLLAAPAQTTTVTSAELATQRTMLAAEIEEREQPVREQANRLPSGVLLALSVAAAVFALGVELRTGMWSAQGITDDSMTIFLFGLLIAFGVITIVHRLMRAIRMPYDGTDPALAHHRLVRPSDDSPAGQ
jgi:cytochrome c-type biogenesis protein CcmH/NrfG